MSGKKKLALGAGAGLGMLAAILVVRAASKHPIVIRGAVITAGADAAKELPIADVNVSLIDGPATRAIRSDASGLFHISLPPWYMRPGFHVTLRFQHADYQPLDLRNVTGEKLYIAHLVPLDRQATAPTRGSEVTIANIVVKYSIHTTSTVNVGSAVKTFQVINTGNVPCKGQRPCSPDGKWRAALGSAVMDAGPGNEFHNARASCIAGPCPFTRLDESGFNPSRYERTLRVSALNWSDTTTFLVEAEVYKPVVSDILRQSYPLVFDRALTFTLPAAAQSVSIEAELNGTMIVFPLGPALLLSWANCQLLVNKDQTKVYRCELKPGFQFL